MTIGLISDSHGYVGQDAIEHLDDCDEVWHAGDIGDLKTAEYLESKYKIRMIYGNIDGSELRITYQKELVFEINELKVFMVHIGGYPGRYTKTAYATIIRERPNLFISGHSHILKVMPDPKFNLLHMNPGSVGKKGFHKFRTMLKFNITNGKVNNLKAIDFGPRSMMR